MTTDQRTTRRAGDAAYRAAHRDAIKAYHAGWRELHPDRLEEYRVRGLPRARTRGLLVSHGITFGDYAHLLARQNGGCAICGKTQTTYPNGRTRRLDVDHDHACCAGTTSCGKCIRGLLCSNCNRGAFGFDPVRLRVAAAYFEGSVAA